MSVLHRIIAIARLAGAGGALIVLAACGIQAPRVPANAPHADAGGLARVAALPQPYAAGDAVAGREVFALCANCHSLSAGGDQANGPSLAGVFGAQAAHRPDYAYSEAMRTSGIVWDARRLDRWIFNPQEAMHGTSMAFIGIRNDKKRRDLIAYLAAVATAP